MGLSSSKNNFYTETYDRGTSFTLETGDLINYYSTNRLDGIGEELLDLADRMEKSHVANSDEPEPENYGFSRVVNIEKDSPWTGNYDDEIESYLRDIEKIMKDQGIRYGINAEVEFINKRYQSTEGVDVIQNYITTFISVTASLNKNSSKLKRVESYGGIDKTSFSWQKIEQNVHELINEIKSLENVRRPKTGNYDIVLSEDTGYSLIHETIGHGCEGDQIINKSSFLTNSLGYKIGSPDLTVIDYPHIRGMGWNEFDDEGTKAQGTILVSEGILTGVLHSKQTAKKYNTFSTGNARTSTYLAPPSPRQTNLMVEPREFSNEELIEDVKNGFLLGPTNSASTSIYTGEFSIETQMTYEIRNGEITNLLGPCTFTGSSNETLGEVRAIGKNPIMVSAPCLKSDSRVYIGSLMPRISIGNARIQ